MAREDATRVTGGRLRLERAAAEAIDAMLVLRSIASEAAGDPAAAVAVSAVRREAEELADFCAHLAPPPERREPPRVVPKLRLTA